MALASTAAPFTRRRLVFAAVVLFFGAFRFLHRFLPLPLHPAKARTRPPERDTATLLLKGGQTRGRFLRCKFFVVRLHRLPPLHLRHPSTAVVAFLGARERASSRDRRRRRDFLILRRLRVCAWAGAEGAIFVRFSSTFIPHIDTHA